MDELKNIVNLKASAAEFIAVLLFVFIGAGVVVSTGTLTLEMTPARLHFDYKNLFDCENISVIPKV